MKILVLEYITGGGMVGKPLPGELAKGGEAMLQALVADLALLPQVTLRVLRDNRLPPLTVKNCSPICFTHPSYWGIASVGVGGLDGRHQVLREEFTTSHGSNTPAAKEIPSRQIFRPVKNNAIEIAPIASPRQWQENWRAGLDWAEAVWIVAPETNGILYGLATDVLAANKYLLGCHPEAIRICSDKLVTGAVLEKGGVDSVPGCLAQEFKNQFPPPWIIKPRNDVGCEGIRRVQSRAELAGYQGQDWILQPYIAGETLSLSAIFAGGGALLLTVNRQHLAWQGESLVLEACSVNISDTDKNSFQRLCAKIARLIPGLWGYVGIDLIRSKDRFFVVEINPRVSLSYTGIRLALGINVAEWVVWLAKGQASLDELASKRRQITGKEIRVMA